MIFKPRLADFFRAHPGLAVFAAVLALGLAALACGQPYNINDLSGTGAQGGAYFVCKTATPVPTMTYVFNERTATPNALGTPQPGSDYDIGLTTPIPTETPYYRQGTFYKDQGAILSGRFEIYLEGLGGGGEYSTATWRIRNRGAAPASLMLSVQTFLASASSPARVTATGADALGLTAPEELDRRQIPAGGEDTRTYAYLIAPGSVQSVGLTTGLPGGADGQTIYFSTSADPAYAAANACAHGPADWLSNDAANAATWNGGAGAPQINGMAGGDGNVALPPPAPGGGYASLPGGVAAGAGGALIPQPYRVASRFLEGGHHGLDLTPCHLLGCASTSGVSAATWILRMGPTKPILAAMGGVVHEANCSNFNWGYGCYVIIRTQIGPDDYVYTFYAHMQPWQNGAVWRTGVADPTCDPSNCNSTTLSKLGLAPAPQFARGGTVTCGQLLGYVGMTGRSSGPHLHWEVRRGPLRAAPYTPSISEQVDPDQTRAYWAQSCGITSELLDPGRTTLP